MARILVIDDEKAIRNTMKDVLCFENYEVETAENALEGLKKLQESNFDITFLDIKMPDMNGVKCLQTIKERGIDTKVVMISAHGNIEIAVDSIKLGAFYYIEKPIDLKKLLAITTKALSVENIENKSTVTPKNPNKNVAGKKSLLIGNTPIIKEIQRLIEKIAVTDARILITGENGVGKEIAARQIYELSRRNKMPFVAVNCAAIPSELIESELFGHEKGSFTSAIKNRMGKFEEANNGTIFLDEIGDMSLSAQAKVLRCLQENIISPVGSNVDIKINVRVIAATNKNLGKEIAAGNFREDLFHRLNVINIHIPALRERKEDIKLFIEFFNNEISKEMNITPKTFTVNAIEELSVLPWRGNVRELRNVVERLIVLSEGEITAENVKSFV